MYIANENRYKNMQYSKVGNSGLYLPQISLGLWHNFGSNDSYDNMKEMIKTAFDLGITHFDLANNYGPISGSAEENFGKILKDELSNYRDELIISTKAGYGMWDGPYGKGGSRKYLISSLDQSLKRLNLDYVDIFYHHCPDPNTPLEETAEALNYIVRSGKALYVGISNYNDEDTKKMSEIMKKLGTPILIHQAKYNMLERQAEDKLQDVLKEEGIGMIAFCPLAQGLLTNKYINGIPNNSRATKSKFLRPERITKEIIEKVKKLDKIANQRGQTLAQMACAWSLRDKTKVSSIIIGASNSMQIKENIEMLKNTNFTKQELDSIEEILK